MMDCPICKSKNAKKRYEKFPGYIEGTAYDIFECKECDTQFISPEKIDKKVYDLIYSQKNTPGYERYFRYARDVKKQRSPLKFLSQKESTYFPVYSFLKNKKPGLKILEVGCSYGYLTYSLNRMGHRAKGIDISKEAIGFARSQFGEYFEVSDLKDYKDEKKFDLIIATELIEHLPDPVGFVQKCKGLLEKEGRIIITTPNKDYNGDAVWKTDLPPVHTVWLSRKSFEKMAKMHGLRYDFTDMSGYVSNSENQLVNLLFSRKKSIPGHVLDRKGGIKQEWMVRSEPLSRKLVKKIIFWAPVRYSSHLLCRVINPQSQTLGVVLKKSW